MMNRFILKFFAVLCISMSADVSAQTYSRFYSDSNIIAKIEKQGYKSNCGVDCEHLYIRLKGNTPVMVSGYIKIRFTECNGGESYTEKYFSETIATYNSSYPFEVNDYYNPNNKHGNYETIGFYIDAITPVGGTSQDSSGDYYNVQKQYFSKTTRFNANDTTNRRCVIYNPDGTCEETGEMLVDGYWVKGVSKGMYYIVGQKIYVCWENMINHEYQLNSNFTSYISYDLKYIIGL